jgi:DGQHR domain-containing protein
MRSQGKSVRKDIHALRVKQWLTDWDKVEWCPAERRSKPQKWFYLFNIPASDLKALSGIYSRTTKGRIRGAEDLGIQRRHEVGRSKEIATFVQYGYPWSALSKHKQESEEFLDLRKPGWLPTAIVVNILLGSDRRLGKGVDSRDLIHVEDGPNGTGKIVLPRGFSGSKWKYRTIPPVEVIDGQHRLWAFEEAKFQGEYELPVVAFVGLDISWQAYLFYTINIKPKKINASLAFDLYPLLRTEDWLTRFDGHTVYRETRAQEIVDLLWSHSSSPWYKRINMLGEPGFRGTMVSQSAWIHSLLATYIKSWEGPNVRIGGLFGSPVGSQKMTLPWSRLEQSAFLIVAGQCLRDSIKSEDHSWMKSLRGGGNQPPAKDDVDLAFFGPHSLLNQDQGIRAFLFATNDLCYVRADSLSLAEWGGQYFVEGDDHTRLTEAVDSLRKETKIVGFLKEVCRILAAYDWRASSAPGLEEEEILLKAAFRGSGGYKALRRHLLQHLSKKENEIAKAAREVSSALGY